MTTGSDYVIWEGPDLTCINLCKGDKITKVIYKMAELLCKLNEGIDLSSIDFSCLVKGDVLPPNSLEKLIQLIIWKICDLEDCCNEQEGGGTPETLIDLPECLYYEENDETITQLDIYSYAELLAGKICDVISDINNINIAIQQLISNVIDIQNTINNLNFDIPTINAACLTNETPGTEVFVTTAVEIIESHLCNLISVLGSNDEVDTIKDYQCAGLSDSAQLANPEELMSELSGWTVSPSNASQSLINLWLTVCDIRAKLALCCVEEEEPCVPTPVDGVEIGSVSLTSGTISWGVPLVPGAIYPTSYQVIITEWDGIAKVGLPIVDTIVAHPGTSYECLIADSSKIYVVEVIAIYESCGESTIVSAYGQLKLQTLGIDFGSDVYHGSSTEDCDGSPAPFDYNQLTLNLVDFYSGLPAINYTGSPILVTVIYERDVCGVTTPVTLVVSIAPGASTGSVIYQSTYNDYCGDSCLATSISPTFCGSSIDNPDVSFMPSITPC